MGNLVLLGMIAACFGGACFFAWVVDKANDAHRFGGIVWSRSVFVGSLWWFVLGVAFFKPIMLGSLKSLSENLNDWHCAHEGLAAQCDGGILIGLMIGGMCMLMLTVIGPAMLFFANLSFPNLYKRMRRA